MLFSLFHVYEGLLRVYLRTLEIFWGNKEPQVRDHWLHLHGRKPAPFSAPSWRLIRPRSAGDLPWGTLFKCLLPSSLGCFQTAFKCIVLLLFLRILPVVPSVRCQGSTCLCWENNNNSLSYCECTKIRESGFTQSCSTIVKDVPWNDWKTV